jgi:hypothetical protein
MELLQKLQCGQRLCWADAESVKVRWKANTYSCGVIKGAVEVRGIRGS